ncbi:NAD-P-binding protein [Auriscalpium vulgare]|uniref:NAD-P-binding protein n=1 Tax=Auriscalpium vulgare TaxID=40419 RepID=A0ACB8RW02_9AGAM|nr:NAD-P-binding protein [Auriscalpium vulgare]
MFARHPTLTRNLRGLIVPQVTGASGFTGSNIVDQLLDVGYKVRGTARSTASERLSANHASVGDKFEVAVIDDLATSDLTAAFKGVDAVVHVASPMAMNIPPEVFLQGAIDGTKRVLEQVAANGIKRFVATSSAIALMGVAGAHSGRKFTEDDWAEITLEDGRTADASPFVAYTVAKTFAEKAIWDFAKEHPDVDVTTVLAPFIYGPSGRGQVLNGPAASTNNFIYSLIHGDKGRPLPSQAMSLPSFAHVGDVARAHVLALKAGPVHKPKRLIIAKYEGTWKEAVEYLQKVRPELKDRLPVLGASEETLPKFATFDSSFAEKVLGFNEYKTWEQTVEETVDDLLKREKEIRV